MSRTDYVARFASLVIMSANDAGLTTDEALVVFQGCIETLTAANAQPEMPEQQMVDLLRSTIKEELQPGRTQVH